MWERTRELQKDMAKAFSGLNTAYSTPSSDLSCCVCVYKFVPKVYIPGPIFLLLFLVIQKLLSATTPCIGHSQCSLEDCVSLFRPLIPVSAALIGCGHPIHLRSYVLESCTLAAVRTASVSQYTRL